MGSSGSNCFVTLLRNCDFFTVWDRENSPEPWNKRDVSDQYRFYSVNVDYSKFKKKSPDF
ncbi:unnamed protein product [Nyctereutes procyonoides]|uniref:(raccoon dog) hypothetical protein n=1 Tax=Nyctereutes procyonoides TaxID=34880 RepID=A0A811YCL4_NYCPR|nr:unnamed protein product [Nyctereutes procyonoides]